MVRQDKHKAGPVLILTGTDRDVAAAAADDDAQTFIVSFTLCGQCRYSVYQ
jgi:hypothetical protein